MGHVYQIQSLSIESNVKENKKKDIENIPQSSLKIVH